MQAEPVAASEEAAAGTAPRHKRNPRSRHRCPRCSNDTLRRQHRTGWDRAVGYILLVRPSRCTKCGYVRWALPTRKDGYRVYLVNIWSVVILLGLLWLALELTSPDFADQPPRIDPLPPIAAGPPQAVPPHEEERGAAASDPAVLPPPASTVSEVDEEPAPVPEAVTAATPPSVQPPPAATTPIATAPVTTAPAAAEEQPGAPVFRPIKAIQVVQEDHRVLVTVQSDRPIEDHQKVPSGDPARVVIDLPGRWRLAEGVQAGRRFGAGQPMRELTLGQHPDFLRLVLRMREPVGEPVITAAPGGLTIQLR